MYDVPLMCMDICTIHEIRSKIGKIDDVAMNTIGDCFSEHVRVKISINITKRLKKFLRI